MWGRSPEAWEEKGKENLQWVEMGLQVGHSCGDLGMLGEGGCD